MASHCTTSALYNKFFDTALPSSRDPQRTPKYASGLVRRAPCLKEFLEQCRRELALPPTGRLLKKRHVCSAHGGNAAIEFVWAVLVLVPILMFMFQIFQATMHGSGGLVKSNLRAFTALDAASPVNHKSIVYAGHATGTYEETDGCTEGCAGKLNFTYEGPLTQYPYGIASFAMQVNRSFVVVLQ